MSTNFTVNDGRISPFDKFIVVYNFNTLNEVFNQGFCFSKKKIEKKPDVVGCWKIKPKKNA